MGPTSTAGRAAEGEVAGKQRHTGQPGHHGSPCLNGSQGTQLPSCPAAATHTCYRPLVQRLKRLLRVDVHA